MSERKEDSNDKELDTVAPYEEGSWNEEGATSEGYWEKESHSRRRRRRGQRHNGHLGEAVTKHAQLAVFGAEVVTPLLAKAIRQQRNER